MSTAAKTNTRIHAGMPETSQLDQRHIAAMTQAGRYRHLKPGDAEFDRVASQYQSPCQSQEEPMTQKPIRACADCGRAAPIMGRGLCGACYRRHKKAGTLDTNHPAASLVRPAPQEEPPMSDLAAEIEYQQQAASRVEPAPCGTCRLCGATAPLIRELCASCTARVGRVQQAATEAGRKDDTDKLDWSAVPFEILEPLVAVCAYGAKKYGAGNCLQPFGNGDSRFFAAAMRHAVAAQHDPLAINDADGGLYHEAQAAWNHLIRLYHAKHSGSQP